MRAAVLRRPRLPPGTLGAERRRYSRIADGDSDYTIALDVDHGVVERLYRALRRKTAHHPPARRGHRGSVTGLGWRGRERLPLANADAGPRARPRPRPSPMISRTIPQRELVAWFADLGSELVVEFPDRDDVMVKRLLARKREGSHPDYNGQRLRSRACGRGSRS